MSIYDHRCMEGLSAEQQATKALKHVIEKLRTDDRLYHLIGLGSLDLLTEAYAALTGEDLAALRKALSSN